MREYTVCRFDIPSGKTEETWFTDEHSALWFAVELSFYQREDNWITVISWILYPNLPGALPPMRHNCTSLRTVKRGVIAYVNIHG